VLKENTSQLTDQELLEKFYSGRDNGWLGILLERYVLLLFGVCMKYLKNEEEAKDAVQQVFLKAITELQRYKVVYFSSWIYKVAKNHCLMKLRKSQGRQTEPIADKHLIVPGAEEQEGFYRESEQMIRLMESCLEELTAEQKLCVTLFYFKKNSYQEIAAQTGYSMMQVKSYIQNGKRNLKILLDKNIYRQK
jgi:RNA polymerase sigma-70 factor (ECF subfamily)